MTDDGYGFEVDQDLLVELGRLLYSASYLEEVLVSIFVTLTNAGPVGDAVSAFQPFSWLIDRTRWLADLQLPEHRRDEVNQWLDRAKKAQEARNKIVHASWYVDLTEVLHTDQGLLRHGLRRFRRQRTTLGYDESLVEAGDVRAIAIECERAGLAGLGLHRYIAFALERD